MGSSSSKKTAERNAVQFRVYSFWNAGDSYASCQNFAETPSVLFDKVAVTQLNDDITFVACYRMKPYTKEDVAALTGILKTAVGSSFVGFILRLQLIEEPSWIPVPRMFASPINELAVLWLLTCQLTSIEAIPSPQTLNDRAIKIPITPHRNIGRSDASAPLSHDLGGVHLRDVQARGTEQDPSQEESESIPLNLKTSAGWAYTVDVTVGGVRVPLKVCHCSSALSYNLREGKLPIEAGGWY
ncbi:hypothetical protein IAT40_007280 [Kwoniella sp. CBS 6097]